MPPLHLHNICPLDLLGQFLPCGTYQQAPSAGTQPVYELEFLKGFETDYRVADTALSAPRLGYQR
jgi:hypothetical protein